MTPQVPKTRQNAGGAGSSLNKVQVQVIKSNNKNNFFSKLIVYWSVFILSDHDSLIVMVQRTILTKVSFRNSKYNWKIIAWFDEFQLSTIGRCEYDKTCALLVRLFDESAARYQELVNTGAGNSPELSVQQGMFTEYVSWILNKV